MDIISPALIFTITSLALALFLWLEVKDPTRKIRLCQTFKRPLIQVLGMITAFFWALSLLVLIPVDHTTALNAFLNAIHAGATEQGASHPMALVTLTGEPLEHVIPLVSEGQRPFFIVAKRTLVALIASGVTAFAFILALSLLLAARSSRSFTEGITRLKNLAWRPALITGILLWIVFNWFLFVWPTRHIFGTNEAGLDRLWVALNLIPSSVPVILWAWLLGLWLLLREKEDHHHE